MTVTGMMPTQDEES